MNIGKQALLNRIDKAKETMEELGELFLSTHTRPIKHTTGHSNVCAVLNDAKAELKKPTIDDAIALVEKMFEKENERLRKIIQSYYSKSWLVTLSKNILAYNIKFQMEIQSALKVLKEVK